MNKQELLEKYNDIERTLLARVLDKAAISKTKNKIVATDFLDQHEQRVVLSLLQKIREKNYVFYGGTENAERKILILYPEKLTEIFKNDIPNKNDYLTVIRIKLPKQLYGEYTHRDYLGGIMKTGLKREKIGDIIVYEEGADILILPEVSKYLQYNLSELTRFSKAKIEIEDLENIKVKEEKFEDIEITVPSMRLDCIVSEILKTSRNKGTEIIKEERVFINFVVECKTSKEIQINDIITIRGKGRFKVSEIVRKTRNGRIVIKVQKYV